MIIKILIASIIIASIYLTYYIYFREHLIRYIVNHVSTECTGTKSITLQYGLASLILGVPQNISTTCIGGQSTIYY
jgi:hypothetical protein